jgi:hypothetical protein
LTIFGRETQLAQSGRERIDTGNSKQFVRRDERGRFTKVVGVGESISRDMKRDAKTKVKKGQGDRGDVR